MNYILLGKASYVSLAANNQLLFASHCCRQVERRIVVWCVVGLWNENLKQDIIYIMHVYTYTGSCGYNRTCAHTIRMQISVKHDYTSTAESYRARTHTIMRVCQSFIQSPHPTFPRAPVCARVRVSPVPAITLAEIV